MATAGSPLPHLSYSEVWGRDIRARTSVAFRLSVSTATTLSLPEGESVFESWDFEGVLITPTSIFMSMGTKIHLNMRLWTCVCCCTTPPTSGLTVKLQLSTYRVFFCNLCFIWKQWCFYRQGQHCNLKTVQISTGVHYLIQISRKCSSQHLNLSHLIRNIPDGSDNVEGWEGQTIVMTGAHVTRTTGGKLPV